jgi:drug/metabolite transporter (DMT)-like permease
MNNPWLLAVLATVCFGAGMISSRLGLRDTDARSGAAISVPTATLLFVIAAPFTVDAAEFSIDAALIFAAVGLVYPALVTLITFRSNELLGPTVTSAISGTAPLFAILAAALLLGEKIPGEAAISALGVAAGVALLSWQPGMTMQAQNGNEILGRALLWPIGGALLRGLAQTGAKAGLLLWANPFAASLIGYLVSSAAVFGAAHARSGGGREAGSKGKRWFMATGVINGAAMLLMYGALARAPVSTVAPVIAAYPLVTVLGSALFLREERLRPQMIAGALITVLAIAWLAMHRR